ncbi:MAG: hypothetical protein MI784_01755 [Cytophagales bacterium]|nr:hypothetical protein [Cytophagales bacterium]
MKAKEKERLFNRFMEGTSRREEEKELLDGDTILNPSESALLAFFHPEKKPCRNLHTEELVRQALRKKPRRSRWKLWTAGAAAASLLALLSWTVLIQKDTAVDQDLLDYMAWQEKQVLYEDNYIIILHQD